MKASNLFPGAVIFRFGIKCEVLSVRKRSHPIGGPVVEISHKRLDTGVVSTINFKPDHELVEV